jgi:hypothetical protein
MRLWEGRERRSSRHSITVVLIFYPFLSKTTENELWEHQNAEVTNCL